MVVDETEAPLARRIFADASRGVGASTIARILNCEGITTRKGRKWTNDVVPYLAFLELVMPPEALATCDRDALADQLSALFGHDLADSPPVVMQQFGAMRKGDATPWLAGFAGIPTLVLSGFHDPIAPPYAGKALAEGIPGARYVELADGSHGLTVQHAGRVNALLLEHLDAAEAARITRGDG